MSWKIRVLTYTIVGLTVDEIGKPGEGLVAHLLPAEARRIRMALRDALKEIGEDPGA